MNHNDSLGYIEVIGLTAAIEAADVMVKSANVKIETVANADAGLITVICRGDLGSCIAAVDAAKAAVSRFGKVFGSRLIPRPSQDVEQLIESHIGNMIKKETAEKPENSAKKVKKVTE